MINRAKLTQEEKVYLDRIEEEAEVYRAYEKIFKKEFPRRSSYHDEHILNQICRCRHSHQLEMNGEG